MRYSRIIKAFSIAALAIVGLAIAHAATPTSYDVNNDPPMYLYQTITATQTTGIQIAAPKRNNANFTYPTTTGAILHFTEGRNKVEDIYYSSAAVDPTSKIITLSGVTRDICPHIAKSIIGCGNGQSFDAGLTTIEETVAAQLLNLKANIDRGNRFTASGAISFNLDGSGSLQFPVFTSQATRDHNIQALDGQTGCSRADGVCYFYFAGGWSAFGTSTTANATEGSSGKVELGTIAQQGAKTGSNNGPLVPQVKNLASSGGTSLAANRIPILNSNGLIPPSVLPGNIFGNGASGSLILSASGTLVNTNLSLNQFTSFQVNTGITLKFATANSGGILRTTGNVTIYGKVNLSGSGANGGAGGATTVAGSPGKIGRTFLFRATTGGGGGGGGHGAQGGGGGGGGGSFAQVGANGTNYSGTTPGSSGATLTSGLISFLANGQVAVANGGGGGGGGGDSTETGGNGGKGGGAMVWYIGGNLKLGSASAIKADGQRGLLTTPTNGGGGGGGGGGAVFILVAGTITNDGVTLSAAGGIGGSNTTTAGGTGGNGSVLIFSLSTGTILSY